MLMEKDTSAIRDEALSFLVNNESGVLSTVSEEGTPRSRQIYYACDDSFNIYFMTLANTRKVADLKANPAAAFVVSQLDIPRTLQIEGAVSDLTETAELDPLVSNFVHALMAKKRFGIPLEHLDAAVVRFFRLTPSWIRWGDFTFGRGTDDVLTVINPNES